jgi:hypothetical protein
MDIVEIIFVSAIIFPFILTAGVMIFVWYWRKQNKEQAELNEIYEDVIEKQDKNLDLYRETLEDYRETFGKI